MFRRQVFQISFDIEIWTERQKKDYARHVLKGMYISLDDYRRKRFAYIFGGAGGASVGRVTEDFFRRWVVQ